MALRVPRLGVPADARPDVTVIVPCSNHGRFLGEALESGLEGHGERLWVIVVDDGSTYPATLAALERLLEGVELGSLRRPR